MKKRVVIIGGGPGGYPAAFILAQKGIDVTLVERDRLGGTCLNRGCIPTKLLLHTAMLLREVKRGAKFGLQIKEVRLDFSRFRKYQDSVVNGLVRGVEKLCQLRNVNLIKGSARFDAPNRLRVEETGKKLEADAVIISTGTIPFRPQLPGIDIPHVIDSDQALMLNKVPSSVVVIGGGYIGLEFAQIFHSLGAEVTVLEMLPRILASEDEEISVALSGFLIQDGLKIVTQAEVKEIRTEKDRASVSYLNGGRIKAVSAERVLVSTGRRPNTNSLGLEGLGLELEKGFVKVDKQMRSNIPGVYAIGDVIGGIMMAHVATAEGETAAEDILGCGRPMEYTSVPRCIYTYPQVAAVGLTEAEAKEVYGDVIVGRFPLQFSGKAQIIGGTGFAKIISEKNLGRIIGVHLVGPNVTEIIGEAVIAINLECTAEELAHSIHPHPTLSEAVMEAAMEIEGYKINKF